MDGAPGVPGLPGVTPVPEPPDGGAIFNDGGTFGTVDWRFVEGAPATRLEPPQLARVVIPIPSGGRSVVVWQHANLGAAPFGGPNTESLFFGTDNAFSATSMAATAFYWSQQYSSLGVGMDPLSGSATASISAFDNQVGVQGLLAHPNFALSSDADFQQLAANLFGLGNAVVFLEKAAPSPTVNPVDGVHVWVDPVTFNLMYRRPDGTTVTIL